MPYNYNSPTGNAQSYNQANANVGRGGAYSQFNYQGGGGGGGGGGIDLAALQNANRGGFGGYNQSGGQNVGYQQPGGQYAGQLGGFGQPQQPQASFQQQNLNTPKVGPNALSPYPTHTNFARPGETGEATNARLMFEYNQRGQTALPDYMDDQKRQNYGGGQQGQGGSGGLAIPLPGQGGGSSSGGFNDPAEIELRRQREIALQRIDDQRQFNDSPFAREIQGSMVGQMRGANSPYPQLTRAQLGENADAGASAFRREQQMARRTGASSGQSGGGAEYSAIRHAGRAQDANVTRGRRSIQSTNALLEDQRRERGRSEATAYLQSMSDNNWRASQAEAAMRSRLQVVGGGGMGSGLAAQGGGSQTGDTGSVGAGTRLGGSGSSVGQGTNGFNYTQGMGNGNPNQGVGSQTAAQTAARLRGEQERRAAEQRLQEQQWNNKYGLGNSGGSSIPMDPAYFG